MKSGVEMTVKIPLEEYKSLIKKADRLARLEAAGVDNWEGYHYAFSEEDLD